MAAMSDIIDYWLCLLTSSLASSASLGWFAQFLTQLSLTFELPIGLIFTPMRTLLFLNSFASSRLLSKIQFIKFNCSRCYKLRSLLTALHLVHLVLLTWPSSLFMFTWLTCLGSLAWCCLHVLCWLDLFACCTSLIHLALLGSLGQLI